MIAPAPLAAPAAVQIDNDLMVAELQLGNLYVIASTHGRAMCGDGAIEHLRFQRLAHADMKSFFAGGQRFDRLGKFTGDIADQGQLRILLERGVLRRGCDFRWGLALGLRVVRGCSGVREEGNLFRRRKVQRGVGGRTKAVDPRDVRVSQEQKRQRHGKPVRHKHYGPPRGWGPSSLFYDAAEPLNRCLAREDNSLLALLSFL